MGWLDFRLGLRDGNEKTHPDLTQPVLDQLALNGDTGLTPRHVIHYAYPRRDHAADYKDVAALLRGRGYQARRAVADGGVVFEHRTAVNTEAFTGEVEALWDLLDDKSWDYDGWESELIAPVQPEEEQTQ